MSNGFHDRLGLKQHHHPIDYLAEANALMNGFALYPQLFKALATRDVRGLAPTTFLILFVAQIIWLLYGLHRKTLPVTVASILNGIGAGALLVLILIWS